MIKFSILSTLFFISSISVIPTAAADLAPLPDIVCIQCHSVQPGRLGEPVKLWRGSIHAANGVACNNCHGGDPKDAVNAMSPARGFLGVPKEKDIPAFCGRCHVGVAGDFMKSAHGRALRKGGPTCVTCHSNHLVVKATLDIINEKNCGRCHSYDKVRVIRETMQATESRIISLDERIEVYKGEGVDTDRLEKGLFAVRNSFHTLFHDVDVNAVTRESARINADLDNVDRSLAAIGSQKEKRKKAGAAVIALALVASLLFYLLRKSYD
jgi:hypothetical protein